MVQTEAGAVVCEVQIAASPETIFPYFTDPNRMTRWMGVEATLDPRPNGLCRVKINERAIGGGTYVEIVPFSRVVFTWGWEGEGHPIPPGSTTVEIVLIPEGNGTVVRLTHRDLPEVARVEHSHGWQHFLARLETVATGGDPGPDPMATADMTSEMKQA